MRELRISVVAVLVLVAPPAAAVPVIGLYRGEAIVTGQENLAERERGFREAMTEVLVKVSGDARLGNDPRLTALLADAGRDVVGFSYEDRLAKKKLMDEQGTRERSYHLRVDFDPAAIDGVLTQLGARPWGADRPLVLVLLGIHDTVGPYVLETASARGYGQREALASIARRSGIPVVLPRTGENETAVSFEEIAQDDPQLAQAAMRAYAADAVLLGTMQMTPDGTWDTRWSLPQQEEMQRWTIAGTTFDRAIAAGLNGTARLFIGAD